MEPWLIAVVLRPFGSLVLYGFTALVAYKVLWHLIPQSKVKTALFDRGIRKRHPWKFGLLTFVAVYGTVCFMVWLLGP